MDDLDAGFDAAAQMTADRALLDAVAAGAPPALRLYRWTAPALSLGRFQPDDDVDHDACARHGVEVVRRPTGGKGLLHGGDLTYSVAMPLPDGAAGGVDAVYERLAGALIAGLAQLGVVAAVARHDGPAGPVCFAAQQGADLRVATASSVDRPRSAGPVPSSSTARSCSNASRSTRPIFFAPEPLR